MEQEKNKVPSQDNENPGSEKFQRAQELYEQYFISNAEADFEKMITVLDSIYKNKVRISANIVAGFILIKQWILQRKKTHMNKS